MFTCLLSLPVVFYSAWIFFDGAWRALRARTLDMMVLVAVAVGAGGAILELAADGVTWAPATLVPPTTSAFSGVYAAGGVAVEVVIGQQRHVEGVVRPFGHHVHDDQPRPGAAATPARGLEEGQPSDPGAAGRSDDSGHLDRQRL